MISGFESIQLTTIILIVVAGFAAGWVDAVVGGGGLLQLPALLLVPGITPVQALATNKMGSIFGTTTSAVTYYGRVKPDLRTAIPMAVIALAGQLRRRRAGRHPAGECLQADHRGGAGRRRAFHRTEAQRRRHHPAAPRRPHALRRGVPDRGRDRFLRRPDRPGHRFLPHHRARLGDGLCLPGSQREGQDREHGHQRRCPAVLPAPRLTPLGCRPAAGPRQHGGRLPGGHAPPSSREAGSSAWCSCLWWAP